MITRFLKKSVAMLMITGAGLLLAWNFASPPLLGEVIPASVAANVKGGADCKYETDVAPPNPCSNVTNGATCALKTATVCTSQMYIGVTGDGTDIAPGDNICCGASTTSCSKVYKDTFDCNNG